MFQTNASVGKHLHGSFPVQQQHINQGSEINFLNIRWTQKQLCFCSAATTRLTKSDPPRKEKQAQLQQSLT